MSFIYVALGGALGAIGRYAISLIPVKSQFPILTVITNILGAILIGFIVGVTGKKSEVSHNAVLFWKTGIYRSIASAAKWYNTYKSCGFFEKWKRKDITYALVGRYRVLDLDIQLRIWQSGSA